MTLGGPIVRDHAAFFSTPACSDSSAPRAPSIGRHHRRRRHVGFGFHRADAVRFQDILRNTYHVDPGSIEQVPVRNPAGNLFAKVSLWPALNQRIELSHNYAHGTLEVPGVSVGDGGYPLSSLSSARPSTVNATRLAWTMSGTRRALQRAHRRAARRTGTLSPRRRVSGAGSDGGRSDRVARRRDEEQLRRAVRQPDRLGADRQRLLDHGRPPPDPRHARRADSPRRSPPAGGRGRPVVLRRVSTPWSRAWRAEYVRDIVSSSGRGDVRGCLRRSSSRSLRAGPVDARTRAHADRRPPIRRAVPADHARPGSGARVRTPGHQYGRHAQRQPPLVATARLQL